MSTLGVEFAFKMLGNMLGIAATTCNTLACFFHGDATLGELT